MARHPLRRQRWPAVTYIRPESILNTCWALCPMIMIIHFLSVFMTARRDAVATAYVVQQVHRVVAHNPHFQSVNSTSCHCCLVMIALIVIAPLMPCPINGQQLTKCMILSGNWWFDNWPLNNRVWQIWIRVWWLPLIRLITLQKCQRTPREVTPFDILSASELAVLCTQTSSAVSQPEMRVKFPWLIRTVTTKASCAFEALSCHRSSFVFI